MPSSCRGSLPALKARRGTADERSGCPSYPSPHRALRASVSAAAARRRCSAIARTRACRAWPRPASSPTCAAQLTLAARLTARLVDDARRRRDGALVVEELHGTFAFYLAAIQRLDGDGVLRLRRGQRPAGRGDDRVPARRAVRPARRSTGASRAPATTALVSRHARRRRLHRARPAHRPALGAERADRRGRDRSGAC